MSTFAVVYLATSLILITKSTKYIPYILLITINLFYYGCGINISSFNLPILRQIIIFSFLIVLLRGELTKIKLVYLDKLIILWGLIFVVAHSILRGTDGFVFIIGNQLHSTFVYFIIRAVLKTEKEYKNLLYLQSILLLIIAFFMLYEELKHFNMLSLFTGAPSTSYIRNGRYRCQGPFGNPILAGTYGAVSLSLILPFLYIEKKKTLFILTAIAGSIIVYTSASSGAVLAALFCCLGYLLWPLRNKMALVKGLTIISIFVISLIMKAPVWYIIAKVGYIIGGTGWHRAYLIDQAVKYFGDWWLVGTVNTAHWFPYVLHTGKADITNQFIAFGVNGGILTMIIFVLIVAHSFRLVGTCLKLTEKFNEQIIIWSIGVTIVGHVTAFFSVNYFDQMFAYFFMNLAYLMFVSSENKTEIHVLNGSS